MISNLSGGAFEIKTGRMWTHGLSMFREKEALNIHFVKNENGLGGRWHFELNGMKFSAKVIAPRIEGIQQHY